MKTYPEMLRIQQELERSKVYATVPEAEDHLPPTLTADAFEQFKRNVSFAHIRKIRDPHSFGVLAVNIERYGIPNYIGPNTFAELAVAFAQSKKLFLLCDIPEAYNDELRAWGAISLNGNLDHLVRAYNSACINGSAQLRLF